MFAIKSVSENESSLAPDTLSRRPTTEPAGLTQRLSNLALAVISAYYQQLASVRMNGDHGHCRSEVPVPLAAKPQPRCDSTVTGGDNYQRLDESVYGGGRRRVYPGGRHNITGKRRRSCSSPAAPQEAGGPGGPAWPKPP